VSIAKSSTVIRLAVVALCCTLAIAFGADASLKAGKAELKSAGPLAFGPNGVLFVGDSSAAAIVALDTGDTKAAKPAGNLEIKGISQKIAALLGTAPDQIRIEDVIVNPISKQIYMSVSRGLGPDAVPVILRVDTAGKISELSLDNIKHSRVSLTDAPTPEADRGRPFQRGVRLQPSLDPLSVS
jgi:hypothetical protein